MDRGLTRLACTGISQARASWPANGQNVDPLIIECRLLGTEPGSIDLTDGSRGAAGSLDGGDKRMTRTVGPDKRIAQPEEARSSSASPQETYHVPEVVGCTAVKAAARDWALYSSEYQGKRDVRAYRQHPLQVDGCPGGAPTLIDEAIESWDSERPEGMGV